jgi:hypothetical protein
MICRLPHKAAYFFSQVREKGATGKKVTPSHRHTPIMMLPRLLRRHLSTESSAGAQAKLEQREEALIELAAKQGIDILRRVDANPPCVLGVVIKARAAKAQMAQVVA